MAKDRHRIFEIYTSQEEAACELVPNSSGIRSDVAALEACLFQHLVVSGEAGITHVRYKGAAISTREVIAQIEDEFVQLANKLSGNSRVLIDFTGVEEFGSAGIQALMVLNKKLQHRGSRMVLCCLDANVRESFFPVS